MKLKNSVSYKLISWITWVKYWIIVTGSACFFIYTVESILIHSGNIAFFANAPRFAFWFYWLCDLFGHFIIFAYFIGVLVLAPYVNCISLAKGSALRFPYTNRACFWLLNESLFTKTSHFTATWTRFRSDNCLIIAITFAFATVNFSAICYQPQKVKGSVFHPSFAFFYPREQRSLGML